MLEGLFSSVFQNLIVATIGGSVMMLYSIGVKRYKQQKLENKYPIEGEYISIFEDIVDGKAESLKAPVTLKQYGKEIKGVTEFESRKWLLEGEISDNGYIYGIYFAESIHDKGVGNFFLEFTNNGDLEGLWSGYDSVNKKIVSGRYLFKKKPRIIISPVKSENITSILNISDKQLGKDYIDSKEFLNDNLIKLQASIDNKIVGFITAKELLREDLFNKIPLLKTNKLKQFDVIEKLGYIGSVAIDPKYEGLGIATELFKEVLNLLYKNNTMILMTGWKSSKGTNVDSIASYFGFENILEIENYWKEDSINYNYDCPICKNPCICSAIIYVKHKN